MAKSNCCGAVVINPDADGLGYCSDCREHCVSETERSPRERWLEDTGRKESDVLCDADGREYVYVEDEQEDCSVIRHKSFYESHLNVEAETAQERGDR